MATKSTKALSVTEMTPAQRLAYARAMATAGSPQTRSARASIKEVIATAYVEGAAFLPDVRALVALKRAERAAEQERLLRSIG